MNLNKKIIALLFVIGLLVMGCSSSNTTENSNTVADNTQNVEVQKNVPTAEKNNEIAAQPTVEKQETTTPVETKTTEPNNEAKAVETTTIDKIYNYDKVKNFEYKMTATAQGTSTSADMKYALSSETVDSKAAWLTTINVETSGAKMLSKTWLDKSTFACLKISNVITYNGQEMETPSECPKTGPNSASNDKMPTVQYLGDESVTVPAGTFNAAKYQIPGTEVMYWYSSTIPIPVKVTMNAEGANSVMELVSWS